MQLKRRLDALELRVEAFQSINHGLFALVFDHAKSNGDEELLEKITDWHGELSNNTELGSDMQVFCLEFLLDRLGRHPVSRRHKS
ncbi:hypothetical protein [Tateyamaria sp.]|uniref:hypothetical protein n=1 Tax=Tateyamaria sp. TaxID=1929288 RepID=UPI003B21C239